MSVISQRVDKGIILKARGEVVQKHVSCFLLFLVAMALVSSCSEIVMRIRLTRKEPSGNKLFWWRRGGDEVTATYQELFPQIRLPLFRRFAFWLVIACACTILLSVLLKSH
jgi:hypothetical protein